MAASHELKQTKKNAYVVRECELVLKLMICLHTPNIINVPLMNLLQHMLKEFPQSYLILDALDECEDRAELMKIIELMAGWQLEEMHVLVTSRKERDIESSLEDIVNRECITCLQHQVVDKDIQTYVCERLSNDKRLKK
jgi:hypothetical protein